MTPPLLEVEALARHHPARTGTIRAVDGVSFTLAAGEVLGLVGESGCGKSTLARTILALEPTTAGRVRFAGTDLASLPPPALRALRRRMQLVFQDPGAALTPWRPVGEAVAEGLHIHRVVPPAEVATRVGTLLASVGLDPALAARRPHELSGGQRQRVGLARALAVDPDLLVLDEPVASLDVSVQAQVLALLAGLRARRDLAMLVIAHDLAVVRQLADRIAVMYAGRLVEVGPADALVTAPRHPYTRALVAAVPTPDPRRRPLPVLLAGEPPSPARAMPGCALAPRCPHPHRDARCTTERPALRAIGGHRVACHHAE